VVTNNDPLTHVLTSAKLDATGLHSVSELSSYIVNIKYRTRSFDVDNNVYLIKSSYWQAPFKGAVQ